MSGMLATQSSPPFVGRQDELTRLQRLLTQGQRLVSVVAPGGYGKSRLAVELILTMQRDHGRECYEVLLAPLGDHRRIPWHAADALGLRLRDDLDPWTQVADFLRGRDALVHFDNFEHLIDGAPLIAQLLEQVPDLQVLVSSREPLHIAGEDVIQLGALPVTNGNGKSLHPESPAALRLFAERAALVDAGFLLTRDNEEAVESVCRQLAGVPLAIELAAAWADSFDLGELQRELKQQLDIESRAEDVPERHRSVRASCDWSYSLLNEYQQLAVRCLAVFKGGFSLAAAAAILPSIDITETIEALASKSWLYGQDTPAGRRFQMHNEAIREYAYQRLLASEDFDIAILAHCRYFGQLLETTHDRLAGSEQLAALQELNPDRENILLSVDTAVRRHDAALQLPLARHLHGYLLLVGAAGLCAEHYARLRDGAAPEAGAEITMLCDLALARALAKLGSFDQARYHGTAARTAAGQAADTHSGALADLALGEIARLAGDHTGARFHLNQGLAVLRTAGDRHGTALALFGLGHVAEVESDFATARTLIGEALELYRELGDQHGIAAALNSMGNMAYREGDYAEACRLHAESLESRRQLGDSWGIAQSLNNLGNVEFAECDYPAAWALYSESLALRQDIGERFGIAASLNNLGNVQYCEGNFEDAQRLHEEGLAIKREIGDYIGCSFSLNNLGNVAVKRGDQAQAADCLRQALTIAREVSSLECMIAPLAISCSLLTAREQNRVAAILAAGVRRQLADTGLALDPMDGGMLEEGTHQAHRRLNHEDIEQVRAAGEAMSLDELVAFALRELGSS